MRAAGGGELLFPAGARVLTAPFNLTSHSILTIAENATVLCSTRGEDYGLVQVGEAIGTLKDRCCKQYSSP
jgi:polygalacturonase